MIIDAHIHIPVISENRTIEQSKALLLEELQQDKVDYAILIPDNYPESVIGDVPSCLKLVQNTPQLFLMGTIDLEKQGSEWIEELANLIEQNKIVGMKIFPGHEPFFPTDRRLDAVYDLCQETETPLVIHTGINPGHPEVAQYNDPKYIAAVAERYPEMKIILAHFFWPEVEYCYEVTHSYPNIYHDTSGLADEEVVEETGFENIQSVLLKTLQDHPEKIVFGTDYAMCNRPAHIQMVNDLPVTEDVREMIFWRNAVKLFKLRIDGS